MWRLKSCLEHWVKYFIPLKYSPYGSNDNRFCSPLSVTFSLTVPLDIAAKLKMFSPDSGQQLGANSTDVSLGLGLKVIAGNFFLLPYSVLNTLFTSIWKVLVTVLCIDFSLKWSCWAKNCFCRISSLETYVPKWKLLLYLYFQFLVRYTK